MDKKNATIETALAPTLKEQVAGMELSEKTGLQIRKVGEAWCFAELLARSGMLPKGMETVEKATVAIIAGSRLGLDPFQSVQGIASINGRPSIWGDAMLAVCKNSGKLEYIRKEIISGKSQEDMGIRVTVKRTDEDEPYVEEFTVGDAKRAGLWGKAGPWTNYPRRMLYQRARAFALRDAFTEYLKGFRSVEEEQDTPDDDIIEGEATVKTDTPAAPVRKRPAKTIGDLAQRPPQALPPLPAAEPKAEPIEAPTEAPAAPVAAPAPKAEPAPEDTPPPMDDDLIAIL